MWGEERPRYRWNFLCAGNGTLYGVTDKGAKSTFTAKVDWGYKFILDKTKIAGSPEKEYKINLNVKPTYAKLNVESSTGISDISIDRKTDSTGNYTGEVIITVIPKVEGEDEIYISAINQNNGNEVIGSEEIDATYDYDGKLNINFDVSLALPGDFYQFTFEVVNDGTIGAMVDSIVKTPELTEEQKKYIN